MNINDMFRTLVSGKELSDEEKIEVAEQSVGNKKNGIAFATILSWENVSIDQKIEIARWLITDNVADILQREMIVSRVSDNPISFTLRAKDCVDSDEDLRKFLTILGAQDIKVSSDFPAYCESYEWSTTIAFKY